MSHYRDGPPEGEDFLQKAQRKIVEEPAVTAGALATVAALYMATRQFRRGNRTGMNQWLRFRVAAQGFTLLAICSYSFSVHKRRQAAAAAGEEPPRHIQSLAMKQKSDEKQDFEKRLEHAVKKTKEEQKLEASDEKGGKVDWKEAWKAGILKKNAENDEKRMKPSERA